MRVSERSKSVMVVHVPEPTYRENNQNAEQDPHFIERGTPRSLLADSRVVFYLLSKLLRLHSAAVRKLAQF